MNTMRILAFVLISMVTTSGLLADAPLRFNYQAVLRDDAGQPIVSETVTVEIAIIEANEDGNVVFSETQQTETNDFGMINLEIGSVNSLGEVDWSAESHFIELTVDGEVMGASPLLSVPYALHAHTSADAFSGDYEDLENLPDLDPYLIIPDPEIGDLAYYTEAGWNGLPIGSEGQVLAVESGKPSWVDAEFVGEPEQVTDIDGNVYETTVIGDQVWMAGNLRTTRYNDGSDIPTNLSATEWTNTEDGAYAIYPHENVEGIDSEEAMIEAYGKLYNFFAIEDERDLCPSGWRVATADDYEDLDAYATFWGGNAKENRETRDGSVAGNYLKSCRQVNSPLDGDCDTSEHPRWDADNEHHGTNEFDFYGLPAGSRDEYGNFSGIGENGYFWTSTELSFAMGRWRRLQHDGGWFYSGFEYKEEGYSVRCIME